MVNDKLVPTFQDRVHIWCVECFGHDYWEDKQERNWRFLEEATELVQSLGMTREEAHELVDYTYDKPVGEPFKELGGTRVTLAALANVNRLSLLEAEDAELERIWQNIDKIRAKHKSKKHKGPLPGKTQ